MGAALGQSGRHFISEHQKFDGDTVYVEIFVFESVHASLSDATCNCCRLFSGTGSGTVMRYVLVI